MSLEFSKKVCGYDMGEVREYIDSLTHDYEEELNKKKDRLTELVEENRKMTAQLAEMTKLVESYRRQEESVGIALIKAEESAKTTIAEAERQRQMELDRISFETKKWEERGDEVRRQLMEFEEKIVSIMEKYQSEINYLASKDVKKTYFKDNIKSNGGKTA